MTSPGVPTNREPHPVIALRNVTKTYEMGSIAVHALHDITLTIEPHEFIAIMGPSGSGKSTLMNIMGCLDVPSRGRFFLDGIDVRTLDENSLARIRNRKIGFVFQSYNLLPRTTALANVELPLVYAGMHETERRRRASLALGTVGLADRLSFMPNELSGGEQQRVAIARAMVTSPALILADEPTGNLDSVAAREVMGILGRLNAAGRAIVVITHEEEIGELAQRVIRLRDGEIVEDRRREGATASTSASSAIRNSASILPEVGS